MNQNSWNRKLSIQKSHELRTFKAVKTKAMVFFSNCSTNLDRSDQRLIPSFVSYITRWWERVTPRHSLPRSQTKTQSETLDWLRENPKVWTFLLSRYRIGEPNRERHDFVTKKSKIREERPRAVTTIPRLRSSPIHNFCLLFSLPLFYL